MHMLLYIYAPISVHEIKKINKHTVFFIGIYTFSLTHM